MDRDRLRSEREFHDRQAQARLAHFRGNPAELLQDDEAYLEHESWIRPALGLLGEVRGLDLLELGSGHGMASVLLSRRGARVTAIDLSAGYLAEARWRAAVNRSRVEFVQGDGARLPFADATFDRVWGNAVLHHLDLPAAARELHRVLRPGGHAVLCEPWGGNRLLSWARKAGFSGRRHTPGEKPLDHRCLARLRRVFPGLEVRGEQLLGAARRLPLPGGLARALDACDRRLLRSFPRFERYCRYVVLVLPREADRGAAEVRRFMLPRP